MNLELDVVKYLDNHGSGIYRVALFPQWTFDTNYHPQHRPRFVNKPDGRTRSLRYNGHRDDKNFYILLQSGEVRIPYVAVQDLHKERRSNPSEKVKTEKVKASKKYL